MVTRQKKMTREWISKLRTVFPTVVICMYRSSALVPLDICLTAAACLSSACSLAVSQASDLALLVGYVA